MAESASIVRFEKVRKTFGPLVVLDNFDFDVTPGEKVAVIGPSGSGKSTLLRVLMTLEPIDDRYVEVDGEPLWHMHRNGQLVPADSRHLRRVRSKVGMVFQLFNLFPNMTSTRNVAIAPRRVLGLSKDEAYQPVD